MDVIVSTEMRQAVLVVASTFRAKTELKTRIVLFGCPTYRTAMNWSGSPGTDAGAEAATLRTESDTRPYPALDVAAEKRKII